jgi:hypothetical protein
VGEYTTGKESAGARGVALQVAFEKQTLKPVFHLIGYRLWVMGLKGYRLWVMGQLDSTCRPHRGWGLRVRAEGAAAKCNVPFVPGVALQVAFEKRILKPVFHLIGYRLWV